MMSLPYFHLFPNNQGLNKIKYKKAESKNTPLDDFSQFLKRSLNHISLAINEWELY